MIRLMTCLALALPLSIAAERASACEMTQMRTSVASILRRYRIQADVCTLSSAQLSAVRHAANGNRSSSAKRRNIKSAVGGGVVATIFGPR